MQLAWVTSEGADAIALDGLSGPALERLRAASPLEQAGLVRVLPTEALDPARSPFAMPATPGAYRILGGRALFVPRFPFVAGCTYSVLVHPDLAGSDDGTIALNLGRPARVDPAVATVEAIHPGCPVIPLNALRLYVQFSHPMSEGFAAGQVRVLDAATGLALDDALLPMGQELWDRARRRLTVLFDPARIKRGLVPHEESGYPLQEGRPVRVEVGTGFLDAAGRPLAEPASRSYEVGPPLRGVVDPAAWEVTAPRAGSRGPVSVHFDRPLDHALAQHALCVEGIRGVATVGAAGRTWIFVPQAPWRDGPHALVAAPILEDIAGNSVVRPFDRDLGSEPYVAAPGGARRPFDVT